MAHWKNNQNYDKNTTFLTMTKNRLWVLVLDLPIYPVESCVVTLEIWRFSSNRLNKFYRHHFSILWSFVWGFMSPAKRQKMWSLYRHCPLLVLLWTAYVCPEPSSCLSQTIRETPEGHWEQQNHIISIKQRPLGSWPEQSSPEKRVDEGHTSPDHFNQETELLSYTLIV